MSSSRWTSPLCLLVVCFLTNVARLGAAEVTAGEPPDLVAYWDFEQGQGAIASDRSGAGNDGNVVGAAWVKGPFGTALWFDGADDYVEVEDAPALNFPGDFTLEAWVNADRVFHAAKVVCKRQGNDGGGYWLDQIHGARMCVYRGGESAAPHVRATSQTHLSPGRWYHMVGTCEGNVLRIYVNNKPEGKAHRPEKTVSNEGVDLLIGTYSSQSTYRWTGLIDEV